MRRRTFVAIVATAIAACGGDDGSTPDAGDGQSELQILTPPGDSIGLAFSADIELRVRYLDPSGEVVPGVAITFELVAGPSEEVGASTLSAPSAGTGDDGIARATVTAGPREANFRIRATAPNAPAALFFVVVSDSGFANFRVQANHAGPRDASDFEAIEFRLFSPDELTCSGLDIDALPDSVLPPRTTAGFADAALFTNLAANRPYTLVVWGEHTPGETRLGVGCVELDATQVAVGPDLRLTVAVRDRPLRWPAAMPMQSAFVFPDLAGDVNAAANPDLWPVLACPLGASQLAIDCTLDAAFDDGALDCQVTAVDPFIDAIEALRGAIDLAGCRPDEIGGGTPSIDQTLADRMTAGPWTLVGAVALAGAQSQFLAGTSLDSELRVASDVAAAHHLIRLRSTAGGLTHEVDLGESGRAVTAATATAVVDDDGVIALGAHGFTLDFDRALTDAFGLLSLPAHGLDGRAGDLGSALMESFENAGTATSACETVSEDLCTAAGSVASCLEVACAAAATALDARLLDWLVALDELGLDFQLAGSAAIADTDFDLEVDRIGDDTQAPTGSWTATLGVAGGASVGVGAFGGQL